MVGIFVLIVPCGKGKIWHENSEAGLCKERNVREVRNGEMLIIF